MGEPVDRTVPTWLGSLANQLTGARYRPRYLSNLTFSA